MKKLIFCVTVLVAVLFASCEEPTASFTMNFSDAKTAISYDDNGVWTNLLNPEVGNIDLTDFFFSHQAVVSEYEWDGETYTSSYYLGWTPSINATADPTIPQSAITKGCIKGEGTPYMVAYWGDYTDFYTGEEYRTTDIYFASTEVITPQYVYLTNTAETVSTILNGGAFGARAFHDGDYLLLKIKPLNELNEVIGGIEVNYYLADFRDGKEFINQSWTRVDLASLGKCNGITFEMVSTDSNEYGSLTPTYFALDGLTIKY